ncbi:MAG: hypothetical protein Q8N55_00775 [bacterium]|nr:hypothetical protein [bacterium]
MYRDKPEDGIKIKIPEGNLYFGWTFERIRELYLRGYPLERILRENYQQHGDYGCINGLPFAFDRNNSAIQGLINGIEEDCDELKNRLKEFLQEIFTQER